VHSAHAMMEIVELAIMAVFRTRAIALVLPADTIITSTEATTFNYSGYSFGFIDAWPDSWYYTDNVYVVYEGRWLLYV
jgi:hypothetical protein